MKKPNRLLRIILIAVAAVAVLALPQRAQAQDSFTPGPSAGQPEISKDGKTETFKDKDGHVTEVREYTDKTRTHKRTTEEIKEYHKNGKPKKVVRTFYFKEDKDDFTPKVEQLPYPEGEYDEETSEYDDKSNRIKEKTKTDHYKDGKKVEKKKTKEKTSEFDSDIKRLKKQMEHPKNGKKKGEPGTPDYGDLYRQYYERREEEEKKGKPKAVNPTSLTPPEATTVSFRAGEVQWNLYGLGGAGHGERLVTDTKTVVRTETVSTTEPALVDVPGIPGLVTRDVTTTREMKVKHTERHTRNVAALQGGFGGAGAEAKVFVTRNIGLGLEGDWLDGERSIGTAMGTVTARFPVGPCAPYVFGGAGVQFGDGTQAVGKLGGGLEHRFSPQTGVFVDAAWMFSDHENAAVFRAGLSLIR